MGYLAITASVAAAALLLGGVLFAFASADANNADASDRFRLLAQAANPFIALLALASAALVVHLRGGGAEHEQRAASAALGIGTAVCLAVVLLALNGVLTDLTGDAGALFRLSAVINRLAAIVLGGLGLWLSLTAVPPKP
jgi:threonine/homoserine/homoserine lactone efflux protein